MKLDTHVDRNNSKYMARCILLALITIELCPFKHEPPSTGVDSAKLLLFICIHDMVINVLHGYHVGPYFI